MHEASIPGVSLAIVKKDGTRELGADVVLHWLMWKGIHHRRYWEFGILVDDFATGQMSQRFPRMCVTLTGTRIYPDDAFISPVRRITTFQQGICSVPEAISKRV